MRRMPVLLPSAVLYEPHQSAYGHNLYLTYTGTDGYVYAEPTPTSDY